MENLVKALIEATEGAVTLAVKAACGIASIISGVLDDGVQKDRQHSAGKNNGGDEIVIIVKCKNKGKRR